MILCALTEHQYKFRAIKNSHEQYGNFFIHQISLTLNHENQTVLIFATTCNISSLLPSPTKTVAVQLQIYCTDQNIQRPLFTLLSVEENTYNEHVKPCGQIKGEFDRSHPVVQ
jgi:hypothetical protein